MLVALIVFVSLLFIRTGERPRLVEASSSTASEGSSQNSPRTSRPSINEPPSPPIFVSSSSVGEGTAGGIFTFRGNPTRSFYGKGPLPVNPEILWSYPGPFNDNQPLCSLSSFQGRQVTWCGTGWTGQPAFRENISGQDWVIFGAYDRQVHFLNADTGIPVISPFLTGDIIKGSVSVDPDNFPLIYVGSRDNYLRVMAIDGNTPRELWRLSAYDPRISETLWNDDWDSSPLIINDYLLAGGENSNFHIIKLNRGYDINGMVTVNPELLYVIPGWDAELLGNLGDNNVSIENSPVVFGSTLYFANSGGLIQGWDLSTIEESAPKQVFRFWAGDDIDSTLTIDEQGMLYGGLERDRLVSSGGEKYRAANERADTVGSIFKINPNIKPTPDQPFAPLVWSVSDSEGVWSTLAVHKGIVYATTQSGRLLAIDADTGQIIWEKTFTGKIWSSPVIVDDKLVVVVPINNQAHLQAYDTAASTPELIWSLELGGIVESTPIVWEGRIFVGTRSGYMLGIGDAN